ncbi:MAG: 6-carboxytetrahydropterin synthase QueD [Candidatus Omnitrophica bacterium]|nr:6-carboxytetrahydropterin synthase QueD [Candidatus Omnitrophota bacterium]
MYKVKIISKFSGAHSLRNYEGKCESLHGHNWKVEVALSSQVLDCAGMVMDFTEMKKETEYILDELDHKHLNEIDYFKKHNPSSEEIARYIFDKLKVQIASRSVSIEEVSVWETDTSCAVYREQS